VRRLALLLVVALASAAVTYLLVGLRESAPKTTRGSDLSWLKSEFALDDAQFAAIGSLHNEYSGQCAQHCADIMAARAKLAALPPNDGTGRAASLQEIAKLEAVCNEATRAHLRRVAAAMPAEEGERFLRTVEPHLAQLPHDGVRALGR
jgi:hypothetical protein